MFLSLFRFTGTRKLIGEGKFIDTDFTSPKSAEYEISGKIFITKELFHDSRCSKIVFRLLEKKPNSTKPIEIMRQNITKEVVNETLNLEKGSGLIIQMNCDDMEFNEAKSILYVIQKICY